jgi:hypothetical protein
VIDAAMWRISQSQRFFTGVIAMRSFLALGLLITLSASAGAATLHHSRMHHHFFVPPSMASSFAAIPGSVHYDDTRSYNDPSQFGGGESLPIH